MRTILGIIGLAIILAGIGIFTVVAAPFVWAINAYIQWKDPRVKRNSAPGMYP